MKQYAFFTMCVVMWSLFGCSKDLTEQEQYQALQDSIKFKLYKSASKTGVPALVTEVNTQTKDKKIKKVLGVEFENDFRTNDAHGTLAMMWILSMKPDFAIAESFIVADNADDKIDQYRAQSLISLAMYQKGWKMLAAQNNDAARAMLNDKALAEKLYHEQVTAYLIIGLLSLHDNDLETARTAFEAFGSLTQATWLSEVVESVMLIRQGKIQSGLLKLKAASDDPNLSDSERLLLKSFLSNVEKEVGQIDGDLFVVRLFGKVLFERVLETDDAPFSALVDRLEAFKKTVTFANE